MMLSPEQLQRLPDNIVRIFQHLDDYIITDIARRLGKTGRITDTVALELEIAKALKTPLKEIEQAIKSASIEAENELALELKKAVVAGLDYEDAIYKKAGINPSELYASGKIAQILNEGLLQTQGEFYNFTRSLGFAIDINGKTQFKPIAKFYQDTLDDALMKVRTGVASYQTAVRQAVKTMSKSGIAFVDYKTGWVNRLDVASRRAVITGANQMNMQMTELLMDELGAEYVEVTAHSGARPDHVEWQGQVYHVGGAADGYKDFESSTGYETGAGLGGWNCRHSFFPYFPGISTRAWTDEQLANIDPPDFKYMGNTYTHYEATQVQRGMETEMRKTKREIIGYEAAEDKSAMQSASIKLNKQKIEYKEFSNAAKLRYRLDRIGVEGYGRSIAQKAASVTRLTHAQRYALNQHVSGSYIINEKLRKALALTAAEKKYIKNLDAALAKMPTYKGSLRRALYFTNDTARLDFIKKHLEGNTVTYREYLSTSKGTSYNPKGQVQIKLLSRAGKDISKYNKAEQEVLFGRNSKFEIIRVVTKNKVVYMTMREV